MLALLSTLFFNEDSDEGNSRTNEARGGGSYECDLLIFVIPALKFELLLEFFWYKKKGKRNPPLLVLTLITSATWTLLMQRV